MAPLSVHFLLPHLNAKVWKVCTGLVNVQANPESMTAVSLLTVTHYKQLTAQPAGSTISDKMSTHPPPIWPKIDSFFAAIWQQFDILLASDYKQDGGGEQAGLDGQVKSGGKS